MAAARALKASTVVSASIASTSLAVIRGRGEAMAGMKAAAGVTFGGRAREMRHEGDDGGV